MYTELATTLATTLVLVVTSTAGAPPARGEYDAEIDRSHTHRVAVEVEVERIRTHLAAVEAELLATNVASLTTAQQGARARHVAVLRAYREAGVFPHNHVVPDRRTPVFVDEHGTHCAVGYLLARDGRADLVARVRATRNTATVHELADDPELVAWLDEAGLTLEEAARIQPRYEYEPPVEEKSGAGYVTASVAGAGLAGGMVAWNLLLDDRAARTLPGVLGLGVGLAEIGLATYGSVAERDGTRDIDRAHVALNLGIGVVTSLVGLRSLVTGARTEPEPAVGLDARQDAQWQLSPWVPGRDAGAGMRLNVRF